MDQKMEYIFGLKNVSFSVTSSIFSPFWLENMNVLFFNEMYVRFPLNGFRQYRLNF